MHENTTQKAMIFAAYQAMIFAAYQSENKRGGFNQRSTVVYHTVHTDHRFTVDESAELAAGPNCPTVLTRFKILVVTVLVLYIVNQIYPCSQMISTSH